MRSVFLIIALSALVWMFWPSWNFSGTEMGFEPGSPDPNTYQETTHLGEPWGWVEWGKSRNEINQPKESVLFEFYLVPFLCHLGVVVLPLILALRIRR